MTPPTASAAAAPGTVQITFPDGRVAPFPIGSTPFDIARSISENLAKMVVIALVDGHEKDLSVPLVRDAHLELIKRSDPRGLEYIRHDTAHILAEAVQTLFPGTQVTLGPNIENGFFYDFYRESGPFTTDDLPAIESKMHEIVDRNSAFMREEWDRDRAIAHFSAIGEHFKAEIIRDLPATEVISVYRQGDWVDLCRGPHMPTTGAVGHAFKLMKVAGAYWRGDSKREVLTRIYGTAWHNEKDLAAYLTQIEEAEKRDHRKLGRELHLFHFQEEAQGSVFWHPRGFTIYNQIEAYIRRRIQADGYVEVKTPQLMDKSFWQASGHWDKFRANMFVVPDEVPLVDDDKPVLPTTDNLMALKPMNCPAHVQIFRQGIKSYRDLPIRMAEFGCCHRNEAHGALHGLMRVRQMTQDDAHIFCREDQITDEAVGFCNLLRDVYKDFGFDSVRVKLALRPDMRAGTDATWDKAEQGLENALKQSGFEYTYAPGDGAFYGPKLEFHLTDAIGRSWQCGTLQLDFVMPERLDASYIGSDGQKHRPVMLHRAILGTLERFIGILIENHAGKLPDWLAPVQIVVASITNDAEDYAQRLVERLTAAGLRAIADVRPEKINAKIREHSLQKIPSLLIVGQKEQEAGTATLRRLGVEVQETKDVAALLSDLTALCCPPF